MTNLTDILSNPPEKNPCHFNKWLVSLSEKDQEAVKKAMLNPEWSHLALTKTLKEHGMPCDRQKLTMHRREECVHCGPI